MTSRVKELVEVSTEAARALKNAGLPFTASALRAAIAAVEAEGDGEVQTIYSVVAGFPDQLLNTVQYDAYHETLETAQKRASRLGAPLEWKIIRKDTRTTIVDSKPSPPEPL